MWGEGWRGAGRFFLMFQLLSEDTRVLAYYYFATVFQLYIIAEKAFKNCFFGTFSFKKSQKSLFSKNRKIQC